MSPTDWSILLGSFVAVSALAYALTKIVVKRRRIEARQRHIRDGYLGDANADQIPLFAQLRRFEEESSKAPPVDIRGET